MEQIQAAALRQSYDLGSGPQSFDQLAFSPNESSNPRPRYSFTSVPAPFAPAEFQRDRIPSTGGWGSDQPDLAALRSRDSGSLAIAPDQTIPSTSPSENDTTKIAQLFSSQLDRSRPAKRQKTDQAYELQQPFAMDLSLLTTYYDQFHPLVGILPEPDTVLRIVADVTHYAVSHAFGTVLELLHGVRPLSVTNGTHDQAQNSQIDPAVTKGRKAIKSSAFENVKQLSDYLQGTLTQDLTSRSSSENLVTVWTLTLTILLAEDDVTPDSPLLATSQLIAASMRILHHLETAEAPLPLSTNDKDYLTEVLQGPLNFTILSSKLDTLSHGTSDFSQTTFPLVERIQTRLASDEASYLFSAANALQNVLAVLAFPIGLPMSANARHASLYTVLPMTRLPFPSLRKESPIVGHFERFVHLVLSRDLSGLFVSGILGAAITVADHLVVEFNKGPAQMVYNPLDVHTYSLVTIVLLEFVQNCSIVGLRQSAAMVLELLQPVLEKRSAQFHQDYGYEWFFASPEPDTNADDYRMTHWTDQLLAMIAWVRQRGVSETVKNATEQIVPDIPGLFRKGALTVMDEFGWHVLNQQETGPSTTES